MSVIWEDACDLMRTEELSWPDLAPLCPDGSGSLAALCKADVSLVPYLSVFRPRPPPPLLLSPDNTTLTQA
jgi:hypothetical protein